MRILVIHQNFPGPIMLDERKIEHQFWGWES